LCCNQLQTLFRDFTLPFLCVRRLVFFLCSLLLSFSSEITEPCNPCYLILSRPLPQGTEICFPFPQANDPTLAPTRFCSVNLLVPLNLRSSSRFSDFPLSFFYLGQPRLSEPGFAGLAFIFRLKNEVVSLGIAPSFSFFRCPRWNSRNG